MLTKLLKYKLLKFKWKLENYKKINTKKRCYSIQIIIKITLKNKKIFFPGSDK